MGKSITSPYAVQIICTPPPGMKKVSFTSSCWFVRNRPATRTKGHGQPTADNLEKYVEAFGKSMNPGGCNAHLSDGLGYIPYPTSAYIKENRPGGTVLAEWKAPMFMVW
jgi:hypothetical protein